MNLKCPNCRLKFDATAPVNGGSFDAVCPRCGHHFCVDMPDIEQNPPLTQANPQSEQEAQQAQLPPAEQAEQLSPQPANQEPLQPTDSEYAVTYVVKKDSNNTAITVALAVVAILLIATIGWLWYQSELRRQEQETTLAELRQKAIQDSILQVQIADSLRQVRKEEERLDRIRQGYIQVLQEKAQIDEYGEYFLYDITQDGTPELWVSAGTCNADTETYVYSVNDDEVYLAYEASWGTYYRGSDYIIIANGHMGYGWWNKVTYDENQFSETEVFTEDISNDSIADYKTPPEPLITTHPLNDYDAIYTTIVMK